MMLMNLLLVMVIILIMSIIISVITLNVLLYALFHCSADCCGVQTYGLYCQRPKRHGFECIMLLTV